MHEPWPLPNSPSDACFLILVPFLFLLKFFLLCPNHKSIDWFRCITISQKIEIFYPLIYLSVDDLLFYFPRSAPCGDITSRTHKDLSLWLIAMTGIVWLKLGMSYTGCWMRYHNASDFHRTSKGGTMKSCRLSLNIHALLWLVTFAWFLCDNNTSCCIYRMSWGMLCF